MVTIYYHVTQDTGSVYTLIENRRLGPGPGEVTDSYLLAQARPPDLRAGPPPGPRAHQRPLLGGVRPQASIDLGMLHQVPPHSLMQSSSWLLVPQKFPSEGS